MKCEFIMQLKLYDFSSVDGKTHLITYPLKLEDDGHVLAILPVIVCHVIDKDSPLYNVSAKQLLEKQ